MPSDLPIPGKLRPVQGQTGERTTIFGRIYGWLMGRNLRAATAGALAAAAWVAAEPAVRRAAGGTHRELRLISGLVSPGRGGNRLGLAVHLANGAAFGLAFQRLGGHGIRRAVLAAQAENAILWPGMAIADRAHPDVRSGAWPKLLTDRGTIAQEIGGHLVFGVVLGVLLPDRD